MSGVVDNTTYTQAEIYAHTHTHTRGLFLVLCLWEKVSVLCASPFQHGGRFCSWCCFSVAVMMSVRVPRFVCECVCACALVGGLVEKDKTCVSRKLCAAFRFTTWSPNLHNGLLLCFSATNLRKTTRHEALRWLSVVPPIPRFCANASHCCVGMAQRQQPTWTQKQQ